jgi:osmotically-inducible protein OsmY
LSKAAATEASPTTQTTDPRPGAAGLLAVESAVEAPEVVVVGEAEARAHIVETMSSLAVSLYSAASIEEAQARVGPSTLAVVLVLPLPDSEPRRALARVREAGDRRALPTFVVVPHAYPGYGARRLYDEGAAAVFEWPGEALLLPRVVREILELETEPGHPGEVDRALEETVAARLHVADGIGDSVTAAVRDGVVRVRGHVASLWRKHRVRNILEHVPGVTGIVDRELEVRPPTRDDDDLQRHVTELVSCVPGIEPATVSVSVHEGEVELAGNVASRGKMQRLVEMITNVEGIREVHNHVVVNHQGAKRSANLARALEGGVRALHPDADVHVSVFGSVAVLTGNVPVLALRSEIERLLRRRNEIDRVVNKISVP